MGRGPGGVLGCLGGSKEKSGGVLKSSGGSEGIPPPPAEGRKGDRSESGGSGASLGRFKEGLGGVLRRL